jgi:hypothetical protein
MPGLALLCFFFFFFYNFQLSDNEFIVSSHEFKETQVPQNPRNLLSRLPKMAPLQIEMFNNGAFLNQEIHGKSRK